MQRYSINQCFPLPQCAAPGVLLFTVPQVQATGIMPPDVGFWGGLVIYWGLPLLIGVVVLMVLWLSRHQIDKHFLRPVLVFTSRAYHNRTFKQVLLYGLPYVVILLYALHEIQADRIAFYGFLLVEVFAVYLVVFWLPLMAVKFLLSFRHHPGDDDQ